MQPITILLTNGFSDWEIALITGAGRLFFGADIRLVSPTGGVVVSAGGMTVSDTAPLQSLSEGILVICGGTIWGTADQPDISSIVHQSQVAGVTLAAICGGTLALAQAGILNALRHTSNGVGYIDALVPTYAGQAHYVSQSQAVSDAGVITAAGVAPVSFAAEVFAAAGLPPEAVAQFRAMLGAEHSA